VKEIRGLQPEGPYSLGGACFGGAVAYEMAQQLRAQSQEIEFLLLVETWPPPEDRPLRDAMLRQSHQVMFLANAARRHMSQMVQHGPGMSPRKLFAAVRERFTIVGEMIAQRDVYRGDSAAMYVDRVSRANTRAFARYRPRPYDGEVHLVLASARPLRSKTDDPRLYWGQLARGGFQRYDIPARDSGLIMKSPHVETLTGWVREALRAARQKAGQGLVRAIGSVAHRAVAGTVLSFLFLM
jgi:thioesterase domain-containing protein